MSSPLSLGSPDSHPGSAEIAPRHDRSRRTIKGVAYGPGTAPCMNVLPPPLPPAPKPTPISFVLKAEDAIMCPKVTHIAFGGGGVRGWAHVGLVEYLLQSRDPLICEATTFVGTSIGAAIALGCALNIPTSRMVALFSRTCKVIASHAGRVDGAVETILRREMLEVTGVERMTFKELSKRDGARHLVTTFTDVLTWRLGVCSVESTPHEDIITSTIDSMRIPGVFGHRPDTATCTCRIDGGFQDNIPVALCPPETTVGFALMGQTGFGGGVRKHRNPSSVTTIDAILAASSMLLAKMPESEVAPVYVNRVISMNTAAVSPLDFGISEAQVEALRKIGYQTAQLLVASRKLYKNCGVTPK